MKRPSQRSNTLLTRSAVLSTAISAAMICNIAIASEAEITDPIAHGEQAHKTHCYKCHSDDVYTRDNRFVKSIDALSKQVVRCKEGSDIPWFDEDADAVVQFLNNKYYKF
ncbi:MAG: cytochrome c [Proteobacteria bacterium]|nr:cytochrome c [Pseudomonadota bacterium]